ncbi:GGDEF domain-containing protein [Gorillibacterium timonense]|uniref:GGDEF domain-containing protein n=1 Tax=Gorillibacterium timonense TaxID=1689269 RepID=UPI00071DA0D0|nr:GGDEF domain-containing protein [Gorillibacterium timonense]
MQLLEVRTYSLAVLSLLIAMLTAGALLTICRTTPKTARIPKILRILSAVVITVCCLGIMHLINRPSGVPFSQLTVWLPSLPAYALTIFLFVLTGFLLRSMLEERDLLKKLAYVDKVTGLLNKNGMDNFWNKNKGRERLAVLFLDLNRFKSVNDTLGHHVGDMLLQQVGERLSQFVRKRRLIYRIGGDEFVIVDRGCTLKEAELLAVSILEAITASYTVDGHSLSISGSIGISMNRSSEKIDRERLLREADSAMYTAKQLGKGRYSVYRRTA